MKRSTKASLTTQYIILFAVFFLLANIVLGFVLQRQSTNMVQGLIRKSMLNVSNTAADLVDGDTISAFTEEDVGSEAYNRILHDLAAFQDNADIKFIYAVRQVGPEDFVFTLDPDPVDPGQFGEEVLVTDALKIAGKGKSAVDDEPAEDRWGNWYSSYSPIFDSEGKVAGIIGVDFSSSWYDNQIRQSTVFVVVISSMFTLVGIVGFFLLGIRVRRRFDYLNKELSVLSSDVESLTQEILTSSGYREHFEKTVQPRNQVDDGVVDGDEIRTLGNRIHAMHKELELYIDFMHAQVNTDALTGVGNTKGFQERQKAINAKILHNSAAFSAVMFDINDLKRINDCYGHAGGDKTIRAAGKVISDIFGKENTYRIGGDEFIVITEGISAEDTAERKRRVEELVAAYNHTKPEDDAKLSLSSGIATFVAGQDLSFQDVFVKADEQMYDKKEIYHRRNGPTRN